MQGKVKPQLMSHQMICLHSFFGLTARETKGWSLAAIRCVVSTAAKSSRVLSLLKCPFYNLLWIIRLSSTDTAFPHYLATSLFNPEDLAWHFRFASWSTTPSSFTPAWTRKSFHSCLGEMGIICFLQMNDQRHPNLSIHLMNVCDVLNISQIWELWEPNKLWCFGAVDTIWRKEGFQAQSIATKL